MMGWYDGWGWGSGLWMFLMMAMWVAVVALVVWAVVRMTRPGRSGGSYGSTHDSQAPMPESPRQVLDRRLASGEIDTETYAAMRRLIEDRGARGAGTSS